MGAYIFLIIGCLFMVIGNPYILFSPVGQVALVLIAILGLLSLSYGIFSVVILFLNVAIGYSFLSGFMSQVVFSNALNFGAWLSIFYYVFTIVVSFISILAYLYVFLSSISLVIQNKFIKSLVITVIVYLVIIGSLLYPYFAGHKIISPNNPPTPQGLSR